MRHWIQFYHLRDDMYVEGLGTDALQPLDGRLNYNSAINEAYARAYNLRNIQDYAAFSILRGRKASQLFQLNGAPFILPSTHRK